jgi:hypothetical protein
VRTLPALQVHDRSRDGPLDAAVLDVRDDVTAGGVVKILLVVLIGLACWVGLGLLVALLINRARNRRPYLAARWDDETGDWVNEEPHDVGPDPLLLLDELTAHLKAYGAEIADYYEPARTGDHTNRHEEGQP